MIFSHNSWHTAHVWKYKSMKEGRKTKKEKRFFFVPSRLEPVTSSGINGLVEYLPHRVGDLVIALHYYTS